MKPDSYLDLILQEGESLTVEFKERLANLDSEIAAFTNAKGGSIFVGVTDDGHIKGIEIDNRVKSQIQDIARNCDPSVPIHLVLHREYNIIEIKVEEGADKPYRCKDGFYLRIGASSQKLKRDEIVQLINQSGKIHFDENINRQFNFPQDLSDVDFDHYLKLCNIHTKLPNTEILQSLNVANENKTNILLNNAGILFFAKSPQSFFKEAYITCVRYKSFDRFSILDKKDFSGSLIQQIEDAINFVLRHISMQISIGQITNSQLGVRREIYEYPIVAIREAIVNAVTHRDYQYDGAHIYVHLFPDRIEIENPGGLYHGLTIENLGQRSVRRNRLIADLLHRAGYIERVGSGFDRMKQALQENNNPPFEVSATNFFIIKFYKRIEETPIQNLSPRQIVILQFLKQHGSITISQIANMLNVSNDTARRGLNSLFEAKLIERLGTGKATRYLLKD